MLDFFISYNKADRRWAEWIAWTLEEAGYSTVLQAWDFRPGSNFVLEMQKAAGEATRTIAVLSPDYLSARFTQPEWAAAFGQDPTGEKGTLLPVRVRECELTGLLPQIVYIDLVGLDEAAGKAALLAGIQSGRVKPAAAPGFPGAAVPRTVAGQPRFPGSLPPIWNVPHQRNPNFAGRDELLAALRASVESCQAAALTQAITGLGGVGKTQTALEYAYRYAAGYDLVWWLHAEEPATLAGGYAALAQPLNLPEKDAREQPEIINAVLRWLQRNGTWLLVFDNAVAPGDIRPYLPGGACGHVIVTSRNPNWRGVAQVLAVPVWPPADAVAFLCKRTGRADTADAEKLANELGCLPLALEQAAGYIEQTAASFAGYLELFKTHQRELLRDFKPASDYPATVATTWDLSFRQVQAESPAAADLLNLCAFFAPDDIPRSLLAAGAGHLPERLSAAISDAFAFDQALAALRRYSLMDVGDEALSVHRLVQAVMRDHLAEDDSKVWATAAGEIVNAAFPFDSDEVSTWSVCSRLLAHALAVAGQAERLGVAADAGGRLLNQVGVYMKGRAQFRDARSCYEWALRIAEAAYGPEHPTVATVVNNLGLALQDLGDLAGAKGCYERALRIVEVAYGPDHATVTTMVNNLGLALQDLGDLAGAKGCYERALRIAEVAYGLEHPTVASPVNNLGGVLQDLGDLAGAKSCFERALRIDEAAYGPEHPDVATDVNNLGGVLQAVGDLAGAKGCSERALRIDEAAYGPEHPDVATDVNNLGGVLQAVGDLAEAKGCYERALAILRQVLGDQHPTTAIVRGNLQALEEQMRKRGK